MDTLTGTSNTKTPVLINYIAIFYYTKEGQAYFNTQKRKLIMFHKSYPRKIIAAEKNLIMEHLSLE